MLKEDQLTIKRSGLHLKRQTNPMVASGSATKRVNTPAIRSNIEYAISPSPVMIPMVYTLRTPLVPVAVI